MKIKFLTYNNADKPVWHYAESEVHGETATCIEDGNTLVLYNYMGIWVNFTGWGYTSKEIIEKAKSFTPQAAIDSLLEAMTMLKILERLAVELNDTGLMARVADAKERKAKAVEAENIAAQEQAAIKLEKSRQLEAERLSSLKDKFLSCDGITGDDFVELCKAEGITLRPNTIGSFRKFQRIQKMEGIESVSFHAPRSVKLSDAMFRTILGLFNDLKKATHGIN